MCQRIRAERSTDMVGDGEVVVSSGSRHHGAVKRAHGGLLRSNVSRGAIRVTGRAHHGLAELDRDDLHRGPHRDPGAVLGPGADRRPADPHRSARMQRFGRLAALSDQRIGSGFDVASSRLPRRLDEPERLLP